MNDQLPAARPRGRHADPNLPVDAPSTATTAIHLPRVDAPAPDAPVLSSFAPPAAPVAESAIDPVAEPVVETSAEPLLAPVAEPSTEPDAEPSTEPADLEEPELPEVDAAAETPPATDAASGPQGTPDGEDDGSAEAEADALPDLVEVEAIDPEPSSTADGPESPFEPAGAETTDEPLVEASADEAPADAASVIEASVIEAPDEASVIAATDQASEAPDETAVSDAPADAWSDERFEDDPAGASRLAVAGGHSAFGEDAAHGGISAPASVATALLDGPPPAAAPAAPPAAGLETTGLDTAGHGDAFVDDDASADSTTAEAPEIPRGRVTAGLLLSLLIIPVGMAAWAALWDFGFITAIVAVAISCGAVLLYRLGSRSRVTTGAAWILAAIVVATLLLAFVAGVAWDLITASDETIATALGSADFWSALGDTLGSAALWQESGIYLAVAGLFAAIGFAGMLIAFGRAPRA